MELYIGGYAQGKLEYVLHTHEGQELKVTEGTKVSVNRENLGTKRYVINHFHLWIKALLEENRNPEEFTDKLLECYPDCIIISDEIGNGIVPVKQQDRDYRERLGRILIELAQKAERVERIVCGIGQRLK